MNYKGLADDYRDDPELMATIRDGKKQLEDHYPKHYASKIAQKKSSQMSHSSSTSTLSRSSSGTMASPEEVNFTARIAVKRPLRDCNELEEYFTLVPEVWEECDPVKWWCARQAQFPNLCRLARDVMTIPGVSLCRSFKNKSLTSSLGSAVAVDHIFSGGRDTISLRRASLKHETIRTLMLVKQRLRLARVAIQDILGDE